VLQRTLSQQDNPMHGFIYAMEQLHEPTEAAFGRLHSYFNPYTTPERFLPFLASMLDLDTYLMPLPPYLPTGINNLRNLIAQAIDLNQERGTNKGLERFLETATGINGFAIRESAKKPFHIQILLPAAAKPYRDFVMKIIQRERPAYTTFELMEG
jgi:phage tail-like protein